MLFDEKQQTDRGSPDAFWKEAPNLILGMGFEPMRFSTADLKPASLTNSDILVRDVHVPEHSDILVRDVHVPEHSDIQVTIV